MVTSSAELKRPKVTAELKDTAVKAGQPAVLEAVMTGQAPQIQWTKDGLEIKPGGAFKILAGLDGRQSLQIKEASPADVGTYAISAKNEWGEATSSVSLLNYS